MKQALTLVSTQLEKMAGWNALTTDQQKEVRREDDALQLSAQKLGLSKMEIGQHLFNLRESLKSARLWDAYIAYRGIDRRSAYRYAKSYEMVKDSLPPSMVKRAMELGFNIYGFSAESPLGEYGNVIKRLPPPQTEDPKKQETYLLKLRDEVRKGRRQRVQGVAEKNYEELVKESFRLIRPRLQRIDKRKRLTALEELCALLLSALGGKSLSVDPKPVPDGYVIPRGRPRKNEEPRPNVAAA